MVEGLHPEPKHTCTSQDAEQSPCLHPAHSLLPMVM